MAIVFEDFPVTAFCRTSSSKQKQERTIESQIDLAETDLLPRIGQTYGSKRYVFVPRHPELHSKKNPSFFCDPGVNLETLDSLEHTTDFSEVLKLCEMGKLKGIWTYDVDRIFRSQDYEVLAKIMNIFRYREISLITPDEIIHPGDRMEEIFLHGPREKRKNMQRKHRGKIYWAKEEGRPSNGQPGFGFKRNKRTKETELVPEEFQILRWCGALTGGWSEDDFPGPLRLVHEKYPQGAPDQRIIDALNEGGLNQVYLNYLDENNYLDRMAKNPTGKFTKTFLIGQFKIDRHRGVKYSHFMASKFVGIPERFLPTVVPREKVKMPLPRVFSDEEWNLIKLKRTKRAKHNKRSRKHPHLIEKKLFCGVCGSACKCRVAVKNYVPKSTGIPTSTKATPYYIHKRCPERYIPGRDLDQAVWLRVREEFLANSTLQGLLHLAGQGITSEKSLESLEKTILACDVKTKSLEAQRERVFTLKIAMGQKAKMSKDDEDRQIKRIEREEEENQLSRKKLQRELKLRHQAQKEAKRIDRLKLEARLDALGFEDKQTVLRAVVEKVVESPDGDRQNRKVQIFFKKMEIAKSDNVA